MHIIINSKQQSWTRANKTMNTSYKNYSSQITASNIDQRFANAAFTKWPWMFLLTIDTTSKYERVLGHLPNALANESRVKIEHGSAPTARSGGWKYNPAMLCIWPQGPFRQFSRDYWLVQSCVLPVGFNMFQPTMFETAARNVHHWSMPTKSSKQSRPKNESESGGLSTSRISNP